jgi:hypothetical protein
VRCVEFAHQSKFDVHIHYCSTLSVFNHVERVTDVELSSNALTVDESSNASGYAQTKAVAQQVCLTFELLLFSLFFFS